MGGINKEKKVEGVCLQSVKVIYQIISIKTHIVIILVQIY